MLSVAIELVIQIQSIPEFFDGGSLCGSDEARVQTRALVIQAMPRIVNDSM
jgi:hypothetical protein